MCYFLTVAVRPGDAKLLEPFRESGFQTEPSWDPVTSAAVGRDDAAFYVTTGLCSCDFYPFVHGRQESEQERLRAKYERRGWTAAKIERALRGHDQAQSRKARTAKKERMRKQFVEAFCRVAASADRVLLFGHWYLGRAKSKNRPPPRRRRLSIEEYAACGGFFPEDEIVVVEGGA